MQEVADGKEWWVACRRILGDAGREGRAAERGQRVPEQCGTVTSRPSWGVRE